MRLAVQKTSMLSGSASPPPSKSQSVRSIIIALLAQGTSTIHHILESEDTDDAQRICQSFGCVVTKKNQQLNLCSSGLPLAPSTTQLYSGNSGLTTHFIMPLLGLRKNNDSPISLNCGEQMRLRPIQPLVSALRNLGMRIEYAEKEGMLPITLSGQLLGGNTKVDGCTSQYLSALLLALPCAQKDSILSVNNLHERPYVDLTLDWLKKQHMSYEHRQKGHQDIYFIPGNQVYQAFTASIAGDFSSASYLIAAAVLMPGQVTLTGLNMQDRQGDKAFIAILQSMGAQIVIEEKKIIITGGKPLTGITIDAKDIPDLLPVLAVLGSQAQGQTRIINVPQARIKETDRIHSMTEGLSLLGAKIIDHLDGITVYHSKLIGASVKGYGDHRTVMALSIAGMCATDTTYIDDAKAINKTFPNYVALMQSLGAKMSLSPCATSS